MSKSYDVVVIGGGPGGYVSAIRSAQLGLKVAVVERENLGGICLNWGCIPTKALLKSAHTYHGIVNHGADYGLKVKDVEFDFDAIIKRSRGVADKLSKGVSFLMKKNKIDVLDGEARFKSANQIVVKGEEEQTVEADNFVIATGARAKQVPGVLEADGKNIWTYREAMTPKKMPKSMVVIGAGAIGVEFASFYNALGVDVTIVETQERIVPIEDAEISKRLEKSFKDEGIKVLTSAKVKSLNSHDDNVDVNIEIDGKTETLNVDKVLLAIGVQGNTENMGLEDIGVKLDTGHVQVDKLYRTGVEGIWAIGDVIGAPWLAHVASHEGVLCAEAIAEKHPHEMRYDNIPGCTYCEPQVASVGFTEEAAQKEGYDVKVGRFDYQANGRALAAGEAQGLVKTVIDAETGELLGAHIIGADATELISSFVIGRHLEVTAEAFAQACLPHPTLSEMMSESMLDSLDRALNA